MVVVVVAVAVSVTVDGSSVSCRLSKCSCKRLVRRLRSGCTVTVAVTVEYAVCVKVTGGAYVTSEIEQSVGAT